MKRSFVFLSLFLAAFSPLFAGGSADLLVYPSDIRLEYHSGTDFDSITGYDLYIRKKSGMNSVLLTETTKDPTGKEPNYAFRALSYNSVNGDEVRYLNGKPLVSEGAKYSLIDSTIEPDSEFGQSFHIFIPADMQYGYTWTRNGQIHIGRGTFINIRVFELPYADYTGAFSDNPYMFDLGAAPEIKREPAVIEPPVLPEPEKKVILTDKYSAAAAARFSEIAGFGGGRLLYSEGPDTLVDDIMSSIDTIDPKDTVDIVFAIDATGSMKNDIEQLRKEWIPRLVADFKNFGNIRIGLLLYRDYGDNFNYKGLPVKLFPFTTDIDEFLKNLNSFTIQGTEGGDIPEAVYEALSAAVQFYPWNDGAQRKIILIGDAEPHPTPRGTGRYSKEFVKNLASEKNIMIDTIILPDDKASRSH